MTISSFKIFYETLEKPELILTIGIPGSGKSTWIKKFNADNKYVVISTDEIRKELTGDISDQSQNEKVFHMAEEAVKRALENGESVIYDATNVDTDLRRKFLSAMPKNIQLKAKIFYVDPEESKRRIKKDIENKTNRANVPDDIIDKMYKKFKHTLTVLKDEGFTLI